MEHWYTFVRFVLTIVNGPYAIASSMNKQTSIYRHCNIITQAIRQPSPRKLRVQVTFLLPSTTRRSMPSMPCLLLLLLTHPNTSSLCILSTISQTPILRTMLPTLHLSLASIGVYMQPVKILKFRSQLSKRLLHMWPNPLFNSLTEI